MMSGQTLMIKIKRVQARFLIYEFLRAKFYCLNFY